MRMDGIAGFDWDEGNRSKCRKHGVSLAEIEELFLDDPQIAPDLAHSAVEDRFVAVGRTRKGRPMFVAFALRRRAGATLISPVSARYMHAKEAQRYEAQGSTSSKR